MGAAEAGVAGYIARLAAVVGAAAGRAFARAVVTQAAPGGRERAKNLLWAAGRLADWGIGLGLEPVPEVLLHPSVIERFTAHAPGLTGLTRRTLRTNLRFLARRRRPALAPADAPLPRERAKAPYSPAEIDGYLALAAAQPTAARRMRAAGPGLPGRRRRADPRRPAARARHRHHLPVRRRHRDRRAAPAAGGAGAGPLPPPLLASAAFAGEHLVTGGTDPAAATSPTRWPARWPAGPGCPGWTPPGCAPPGWPRSRS